MIKNRPIREVLAEARTAPELEQIGLAIQSQATEIPSGEKNVLVMLFWGMCQSITIKKEVFNETMKALGSKARIIAEESSGNLGEIK